MAPSQVLFDSYLPHRSAPNHTNTWRRSAYLTFNARSQGDLHAAYYAKKKRLMREGQHMRLESLLELSAGYQAIAHMTTDHHEAVNAFIEKRPPKFSA